MFGNAEKKSPTIEETKAVRAMDIRKVVADAEWQLVRRGLVGHWCHDHKRNVESLRNYLARHPNDPKALRRVLNVLTGSVHRARHTDEQTETDQLRLEVRQQWAAWLGEDPNSCKGAI